MNMKREIARRAAHSQQGLRAADVRRLDLLPAVLSGKAAAQ